MIKYSFLAAFLLTILGAISPYGIWGDMALGLSLPLWVFMAEVLGVGYGAEMVSWMGGAITLAGIFLAFFIIGLTVRTVVYLFFSLLRKTKNITLDK